MDKWLFCLVNMEKLREIPVSLKDDKVFEKLFRVARLANLNKEEMNAYQRAEMDRMDYYRGLTVARIEGEEIGENKGDRKRQLDVACKMLQKNMSLDIIAEVTDLSETEILALKQTPR